MSTDAGSAEAHAFHAGPYTARVSAAGAELVALEHDGRPLLWNAGPAWPRHSPVLFPIVGRLKDDTLRLGAHTFHLTQHGFARDRAFAWAERRADGCRLVLQDDDATRAAYPFAFRLELDYALSEEGLRVGYRLTDTGDEPLPASLGAHPAFRWPLVEGVAPEAHRVVFAEPEPEPIRRLDGGLIGPAPYASPVQGRVLALDPTLFDADALIFDRPRSRALRYQAGDALELELAWEGFSELGLWSRRPNGFLCIEPWKGFASPQGFDGDFRDKPGLMHLAPGETRELSWSVRVA